MHTPPLSELLLGILATLVQIAPAIVAFVFIYGKKGRQEVLPLWFRARIFIPVLLVLYLCCGGLFAFEPDTLVHGLPRFMVGDNDWGTGNIYVFTKMAYGLGLLAGTAACLRLETGCTTVLAGIKSRFRLLLPHYLSALAIPLPGFLFAVFINLFLPEKTNNWDMDILFAWFTAGFLGILALLSLAGTRPSTKPLVNLLATFVAIGWYFIPVALLHP